MQNENSSAAVAGHPPLPRLFIRSALCLPVAGFLLWLLARRLADTEPAQILAALNSIAVENWLLSLCFAAISFAAIGEYDRLFHRVTGSAITAAEARATGMAAMALAQVLGLGVLSGALARWRLVAGFDLWAATRFSALISASFLAGYGAFTAVVILIAPSLATLPVQAVIFCGWALALVAVLIAMSVVLRRVVFQGRVLILPPLARLVRLFAVVAVDCLGAAACAYVLMPAEMGVGFAAFLPVFLLALGAGLISGAPAGVGPFELTLLTLLPQAGGNEALLASALAFRVVYFVIPALVAMVILLRGPRQVAQPLRPTAPVKLPAESCLARQGWFDLLSDGQTTQLVAPTGQALVALRDAVGSSEQALKVLTVHAAAQERFPCFYKIGPRSAVTAARAGFTVLRIAEEAVIDPQGFALSSPACAGLRRKLRKVDAVGLRIARLDDRLPFSRLTAINTEWAAGHGGERGFSMGRYASEHLPCRIVLLARQNDRITAFVTFAVETGVKGTIWRLDLMRHVDDVAEGTMHALIAHAIALARSERINRLSLAAAPALRLKSGNGSAAVLLDRAVAYLARRLSGGGLRQFKQSFAPRWEPLYIAAPGLFRLCLAGAEIGAAIIRPGPLAATAPPLSVCLETRTMP